MEYYIVRDSMFKITDLDYYKLTIFSCTAHAFKAICDYMKYHSATIKDFCIIEKHSHYFDYEVKLYFKKDYDDDDITHNISFYIQKVVID